MKQKLVTLLLVGASAAMLTGCGQKKQIPDPAEMLESIVEEETLSETIKELNAADEAAAKEREERETEKQEIIETYQVFPKSPEWDSAELPEQPIQIDDVFLTMGLKASDVLSRLEQSSIHYEIDETPEILVPGNAEKKIVVSRDGFPWFTLSAKNVWDEAKTLGELPVVRIELEDQAMPYAYILDGRSYEDLLSMTYSDLKADPVLSRYQMDEGSGSFEGEDGEWIDTIRLTFNSFQSGDDRLMDGEWSGYTFTNSVIYEFEVDAASLKTLEAKMHPSMGYSWVESGRAAINELTEITPEELEVLRGIIYDAASKWYERSDGVITGYVITEGNPLITMDAAEITETPTKDFNFIITFPEGMYGTVEINQFYREADGELWYHDISNLWDPTDSMDTINERYHNEPVIPFE